jgi:hypothetical protein
MGIREDLLASATFLGGGISGGVYTDVSPNAVTGTVGAGITASLGPMGSAAIDSTGDIGAEVTIASASTGGISLAADMAWSFWVKPNTRARAVNGIFSHGSFASNRGWYFWFDLMPLNRMGIAFHQWILGVTTAFTDGTWHHVAIYLGPSGSPVVSFDGAAMTVDVLLGTRPGTLLPSTANAKVLGDVGGVDRSLDGELSEPFVMRRNFAAGEIAWLADPANSLLVGGGSIIPILRQHYAAQGAR